MQILHKILSFGGLLPNGKTLTGLYSLIVFLVLNFAPEYIPLLEKCLAIAASVGLPVGVLDRIAKAKIKKAKGL